MIRTLFAVAWLLAMGTSHAQSVEWTRGLWFDGAKFVPGKRWSVDGVFVGREPGRIDRVEDLDNRYVVPAYGDAHHHGIDSSDGLADKITVFLEAGIFYVKNPNVIPELLTPEVRSKLNRPDSVDVVFSNGGLTSTGGHPVPLHAYLASVGVFPGLKPEGMENRAYFIIDSEADLEAKWPKILAEKPDFIKTFLLFTDALPGGQSTFFHLESERRSAGSSPSPLREGDISPAPLGEGRGGGGATVSLPTPLGEGRGGGGATVSLTTPLGEVRGGGKPGSDPWEGRGAGYHGLDPKVLAAIVQRAHASGLRVTSHIDTAADFRHAVEAGVDEINHLPQPDQRYSPDLSAYVIDAAAARLAARKHITVVTTASTTERLSPGLAAEWLPAMRANQVANLRTLREAGVKLAIGSDAISGERRYVTARDEVRFLAAKKMLDPLALLQAWAVNTPKTIFPGRKVGELREGFEVNFLVLGGDPLEDPDQLHRIAMRVKEGRVLPPMPVIVLGR